ncbi:MAG: shikimate dehydrogenase [Verrucomicrobiota bacterium]
MKHSYNLDEIGEIPGDVDRYAVIGDPVDHSLSPDLHQAGFNGINRQANYVRIHLSPDQLEAGIQKMREMRFKGWNCTLPHKAKLMELIDESSENAQLMRATNTILNENGKLIGFNTDGEGWVRAIREEFFVDIRDMRIMVLGIGGAGQAIATQAAIESCERLVLVNRTVDKAQRIASSIEHYFESEQLVGAEQKLKVIPFEEEPVKEELNTIDLVVNCMSLGLKSSDPPVLPSRVLQPHLFVYDTIYKPSKTKLLQAAEKVGARCANGLSMLLHQGALSFEIWTGVEAPLAEMRQALKKALTE